MSKTNTGVPAFPQVSTDQHGDLHQPGLSMRDYFAAKALQGFMVGLKLAQDIGPEMQDRIALGMYSMADAMLKAREA